MAAFNTDLLRQDQQFLQALAKLARGWPALTDVNDGRSLADFLQAGRDRFAAAEVRAAATTAGLGDVYDTVAGALDQVWRLTEAFQTSPVAPLFDRLDRFSTPGATPDPGRIIWRPLHIAAAPPAGPVALAIKADAGIAFDADDRWPEAADVETDPDLGLLLSVRADGDASANGRASWPFALGTVTAAAGVAVTPAVACYFAPRDRSRLFGEALAESLASLPDPLSLTSLWKQAQSSDFKGMVLSVDGSFHIESEIAVAAVGDLQGVKLGATVSVKAALRRQSGLTLSVRALPAAGGIRPLALRIGRQMTGGSSLGVKIGIAIDPTALTARVATAVNRALDWQDAQLNRLRPFLTPGTWLAGRLTEAVGALVADAGLRDALLQDFAASRADTASGVSDWLAGLVADAFDSRAARVLDRADQAATTAVAAVAGELATVLGPQLSRTLAADANGAIGRALEALVANVRTELQQQLTGLVQPGVRRLDQRLGDVGVAVQRAVVSLDDAFAAVRDLVAAWEALVAKFRAKVEEAAKAKLQAELAWEESQTSLSQYLIAGTITSDQGAPLAALWRALLAGNFSAAEQLLRGGDGVVPGFALDRQRSWLLRRRQWQQRLGFRLTVLGFSASVGSSLSATTEVRITGTGDVTAMGVAEASSHRDSGPVAQEASVRTMLRLAEANGIAGASRLAQLALRIDRRYKDIDVKAFAAFLDEIRGCNLISRAAAQGAVEWVQRRAAGAGDKLPCEVSLAMVVDDEGMARLLRLGADLNRPALHEATQRRLYNAAIAALTAKGDISQSQLHDCLGVALQQVRDGFRDGLPDHPEPFDILVRLPRQTSFQATGALDGGLARPYNLLLHYVGGRMATGTVVRGGIPGMIDLFDALDDAQRLPAAVDSRQRLDQLQPLVARMAAGALPFVADTVLLRSWAALAPRLRVLLVFLAGLVDPAWSIAGGRPPLLLTIKPLSGDTEPLVFV